MPRESREKSASGIYHIIMRGINYQSLFEEDEDRVKFIQIIQKYRKICGFKLYAYCLMSNHLHLLLLEGKEPLGTLMRRICSSYVLWYNNKYGRIGYLFQGRFKSEPIESQVYFLTVLRYIFQNSIKAGIVKKVQNYVWTNYMDYLEGSDNSDTDFALSIFQSDRRKAISNFIQYINRNNDDKCLDMAEKRRISDDEAQKIIREHLRIQHAIDIQKYDIGKRNECLRELKQVNGLSIRQIERLTGVGKWIIQNA